MISDPQTSTAMMTLEVFYLEFPGEMRANRKLIRLAGKFVGASLPRLRSGQGRVALYCYCEKT